LLLAWAPVQVTALAGVQVIDSVQPFSTGYSGKILTDQGPGFENERRKTPVAVTPAKVKAGNRKIHLSLVAGLSRDLV